ncbi:hypothetical protein FDP41_006377 [Naegleria fowleri]|uniref:Uncharacterized protein n=1 Tax=Naegleria fowleri TaxID=5763 RepID=A0A6A5BL44_NAEFO|nr:uncharacterized protein FDP41_006377 [Naegleria fowleri]KAF0974345.1 hypothetical protein FDP41_006377 [Naegleria fowleri]CAG4709170.1 unnamed protein product [Naegleria fowleri]
MQILNHRLLVFISLTTLLVCILALSSHHDRVFQQDCCSSGFFGMNVVAEENEEDAAANFWNAIPTKIIETTTTTTTSLDDTDASTIHHHDEEEEEPHTTFTKLKEEGSTKTALSENNEEDEFEFTEDDFTSIQSKINLQQQEDNKENAAADETAEKEPVRLFGFPKQEHFYYEMGIGAFILVSLLVYLMGRTSAESTFKNWTENNALRRVLEKHFTKVNFMRDGANQFIVYATGNEVMKHLTFKVTFPNKQDLLMGMIVKPFMSMLSGGSLFGETEIILEVILPRSFAVLFGFCDPKNYKSFLKQHEPLQLYTKHASCEVAGKQYAVFTDTPGLIAKVMSQSFVSNLQGELLISDLLKPRIADTHLIQCITLKTKISYDKTLSNSTEIVSKTNKKLKFENWLDELLYFMSFEFTLTPQEAERNMKNRLEIQENIEQEKKKEKLKEESKENRLKKLSKKK